MLLLHQKIQLDGNVALHHTQLKHPLSADKNQNEQDNLYLQNDRNQNSFVFHKLSINYSKPIELYLHPKKNENNRKIEFHRYLNCLKIQM